MGAVPPVHAPWPIDEFIEHAPLGVGFLDREMRFVQVNERLAEINGVPVEDHVGRRPQDLLPELPVEAYLPSLRRALAGEKVEAVELTGETPAQPGVERHWVESWAPARASDGHIAGVMVFVAEVTDRRRAERALREAERRARTRAEALAALAATMAAVSTVEDLAAAVVARAAAPAEAAFANVALLDEGGERLRLRHGATLDDDIARRWSVVALDAPVPIADAARRREAVFVSSPEDNAERYPLMVADTARAGLAATASLPLLDRDGRGLGALGFAWTQPQRFDIELRSVLRTIAELVGQSLQRARLYETEQRAREHASLLAEASTAIALPGAMGARLQRVCDLLVPRFADLAIAELAAEPSGGVTVGLAHRDRARLPALRALRDHHAGREDASQGTARIIATGEPQLIADMPEALLEEHEDDRETRELLEQVGVGSYVGVPLRAGGAVIGALAFGHGGSGRRFDVADLAFAEDLGVRVGLALDNVRLAEAEHEIATELQQRMLPAHLSAPEGVALAARYRAAHARLAIGGDWYDVVTLPDGRLVIAVGDIVGSGPRAAAAMGQVRSALGALAFDAHGPADLIMRLDAFAGRTPDVQFSTVCVAFLDPSTGDLAYACAGHPPPLALGRDGVARFLEHGRSPILYVGDGERPDARVRLSPGARLLFYTDGLVERRDASIDAGLARLHESARAHCTRPIESFCDGVLADLLDPDTATDDTAVLCVELADRPAARGTVARDGGIAAGAAR